MQITTDSRFLLSVLVVIRACTVRLCVCVFVCVCVCVRAAGGMAGRVLDLICV